MKSNQQVKFKETEIGNIPEDWEIINGADCLILDIGSRPKGGVTNKGDIPSLGGEHIDMNSGRIDFFKSPKYISVHYFGSLKRGKLKKDDILINKDGAYTGKLAFTWELFAKEIAINEHLFIIRNKGQFNKKFLFYYFSSKVGKYQIRQHITGSAQPGLNRQFIDKISLPLPSIKEQSCIANVLSSFDEKINNYAKMNKTLEKIGQALFKHWFVDFDFPNEKGEPYKSSGGEMVDSELGEIPRNWTICKLGSIMERITKGTTPTTIGGRFTDEGINFVKVEAITEESVFLRDKFNYIDCETNDLLKRSIIKENDLLFSIAGSIGRVAFVSKDILPANTNQAIAIIRLKKKQNSLFIKQYLKSKLFQRYIDERIVQAVQANISLGIISDVSIVYPPSVILEKINKMFWPIQNKMKNNQRQIDKLSQIRDSLLPRLMSGRIRVGMNLYEV